MIHDFPRHDQPTPDRDPSFSGHTTLWMIENLKVVDLFFCRKKCVRKYHKETDSKFARKNLMMV